MATVTNTGRRKSSMTAEISRPSMPELPFETDDTGAAEHMVPSIGPQQQKLEVTQKEEFHRSQSISPLPPAHELVELEKVQPGTTNRLLTLLEEEQKHRHALDTKEHNAYAMVVRADFVTTKRSQRYALVVALFTLGIAGAVAIFGNPWAGAVIAGLDIAGIVASFMYGTAKQAKALRSSEGDAEDDLEPADED